MKKRKVAHKLCRPTEKMNNCMRLGKNMQWNRDNGKPGYAFSFQDSRFYPITMYVECNCRDKKCPKVVSCLYTTKRFGCSNGRPIPPE